jgi:hypothetical protein
MVPRRDVNQWKQACREVGLDKSLWERASRDFHAEKEAFGEKRHLPYGNLIIWLREWMENR